MYSLDDFTYLFTRKDLDILNALRSKNKKNNGWIGVNQLKEALYNLIVFFKMGMISPASSREIEKLCSLFNKLDNLISQNNITKENLRRECSVIAKEHFELEAEAYRIAPMSSQQEKAKFLISRMIDIEISHDKLLDQVFSLEIEENKIRAGLGEIRTGLGEIEIKLSIQKKLFEEREQEKLKLKQMIREFTSFSLITIAIEKNSLIWKQKRMNRCSTQPQLSNKLHTNSFRKITDTAKVAFDKEAEIKYRLTEMARGRGLDFHLWD